jgi:hypothetical protein|eukprot:COSAG06_NODE_626_length_13665_cov_18.589619_5_plen_84_part_00
MEAYYLTFSCETFGGWDGPLCDNHGGQGVMGRDGCGCDINSGWSNSEGGCKVGGRTKLPRASTVVGAAGGGHWDGSASARTRI